MTVVMNKNETNGDTVIVKEGSSSDEDWSTDSGKEGQNEIVEFPGPEKQRKQRTAQKAGVRRQSKRERNEKLDLKRQKDRMGLVKPDVVEDRVKERSLVRLATKGVVQLFNAVNERQKELDAKVGKVRSAEVRKRGLPQFDTDSFGRKLKRHQLKDEDADTKPDSFSAPKKEIDDIAEHSDVKDEPLSDDDILLL